MSFRRGPNIVKQGLVLHLDAANQRSFRGEPTTNLLSNYVDPTFENGTKTNDGWTFDAKVDGSYEYYSNDSYSGKYSIKLTNSTQNNIAFWKNNIPVTSGVQYTVSVYAKNIDCPNIPFFSGTNLDEGSSYFSEISINEWKRFSKTFTATNTGDADFYIRVNGDNTQGSFLIDNFQIEQKPYPTPFVNGTRGTTFETGGGWKDLSANSNHGELVNGVQYDSSNKGSLVFDGVNDYVSITYPVFTSPTALTIGGWFRKVSGGTNYETVLHQSTDTSIGSSAYWFGVDLNDKITATIGARTGVGWNAGQTTIVVSYDKWYSVFASWDGSSVKVYVNGELIKSYSLNTYTDPGTVTRIGASGDASGYLFSGYVGPTFIYNRALTSQEVLQNYNALKDRFGL